MAPRRVSASAVRVLTVAVTLTSIVAGTASPALAEPTPIFTTVCTHYYLSTAYGAANACTQTRSVPGSLRARAGYFNRNTNTYLWETSTFAPASGASYNCGWTQNSHQFFGGRHMSTAYGSAFWGMEVLPSAAQPTRGRGRFGWFNLHTLTFSHSTDWLPMTWTPQDLACHVIN